MQASIDTGTLRMEILVGLYTSLSNKINHFLCQEEES